MITVETTNKKTIQDPMVDSLHRSIHNADTWPCDLPLITYLQFLKKIYHSTEFRATSELILWVAIGCGIAWKTNPNTFSNPGLEFFFTAFFSIHGLIRFAYLLFRTEIKP